MRCTSTSVSVSLLKVWPSSMRAFDGTVIFYDAIVHQGEPFIAGVMGVGVDVIGFTVVAHLVWPIPVHPSVFTRAAAVSSSATLPFFLTVLYGHWGMLIPALSYPRYSSRFNPSRMMGCFSPMYATIPHDVSLGSSCKYVFLLIYSSKAPPDLRGCYCSVYATFKVMGRLAVLAPSGWLCSLCLIVGKHWSITFDQR